MCSGLVFRLAKDVLLPESFDEASRIMLGPAWDASKTVVDLYTAEGKPIYRARCQDPMMIKSVVDLLEPRAESLIPGFSGSTYEAHFCWDLDGQESLKHLDGNVGEERFVAVYSAGAPGLLGIRNNIPGE